MAFNPHTYRNNKDGIGAPGDAAAANSTDDNTLVSLIKGLYALLSGTITVSAPVGAATSAKQDIGNTTLTAIDGHVDGIETLIGTTNTLNGAVTETAPASDTASSGLNGRLQRIAQRLTTLIGTTLTTQLAAATNAVTTAYATNLVVKQSSGTLYGLSGYNSKTSAQFIQIHDAAALPADTAVPKVVFTVPASSNFSIDFGARGRAFAVGVVVCNSSTGPTKTIGSADIWVDVQYA
jgi:hypothetical protein